MLSRFWPFYDVKMMIVFVIANLVGTRTYMSKYMNFHLLSAKRNGYAKKLRWSAFSLIIKDRSHGSFSPCHDVMSPMMMIRTSDIRQESGHRESRKWRPSVSLIPHQSQSQAALSFIHEAEMSVSVLRFRIKGLVFKQMKYGYATIGSRIECLVWRPL